MQIPNTYTDDNPTNCCPVFNAAERDELTLEWDNKLFIRGYTKSFLYMPLNMGKVMSRLCHVIEEADANLPWAERTFLSHDLSPWKCENLYAVQKEIPGEDHVRLSGTFMTKVFEGPYSNVGKWMKEMKQYVSDQGKETKKIYRFYTTCPKCARQYGKNYVVAFAQLS